VHVAVDDDVRLDAVEDLAQALLRCQARHDLLVAPRRRVAEEHAAEPVDVERHRERPGEHGRVTLVAQSFASPRLEVAVGVPEHDERSIAQSLHALERLRRPRARDHVAAEHDPVDVLPLDLREHGVERRQVAVHVVERRDAHYAGTAAAAGCTGSRGPAQTTSSAGQPAHA
jgi:hypothetical protein